MNVPENCVYLLLISKKIIEKSRISVGDTLNINMKLVDNSVHLAYYPEVNGELIDREVEEKMDLVPLIMEIHYKLMTIIYSIYSVNNVRGQRF